VTGFRGLWEGGLSCDWISGFGGSGLDGRALTHGHPSPFQGNYGTNWLTRAITERTQSAVLIVLSVRYRGITERIPLALPGMGSFFHLALVWATRASERHLA
jgi:hypothetical protein